MYLDYRRIMKPYVTDKFKEMLLAGKIDFDLIDGRAATIPADIVIEMQTTPELEAFCRLFGPIGFKLSFQARDKGRLLLESEPENVRIYPDATITLQHFAKVEIE